MVFILFKPNSPILTERSLLQQGFKTFLPMQKITLRKASRFVNDFRPLFPGYMFVSVNPDLAPWRSINSTIGVSKLVSFNSKPKPLPPQLISGLMLRCDTSGTFITQKNPSKGDRVELLTGPFAKFIATVETIDHKQRIWALMDFMGQKTRMQITNYQWQTHRKANQ